MILRIGSTGSAVAQLQLTLNGLARAKYFSLPDGELFGLAYQGKLRQNLDAQVQRMLKDSKSDALVQNFAGQWLQLRSLDVQTPDPKRFPKWSKELREAMQQAG